MLDRLRFLRYCAGEEPGPALPIRDTLLALIHGVLDGELGVYRHVVLWLEEDGKKRDPEIYEEPMEEFPSELEEMHTTGVLKRETLSEYRISCRLYNKSLEIQKSHKAYGRRAWAICASMTYGIPGRLGIGRRGRRPMS